MNERRKRILVLFASAAFSLGWLLWRWDNPTDTYGQNHEQSAIEHAAAVAFAIGRVLIAAILVENTK